MDQYCQCDILLGVGCLAAALLWCKVMASACSWCAAGDVWSSVDIETIT